MIKGSKPNFDQLIDNYQDLELYDYGSVMHYIAFAFSRNGGPVIESKPAGIPLSNLAGYTAADIDSVARLYGAAPKSVTITTNPPALTSSSTAPQLPRRRPSPGRSIRATPFRFRPVYRPWRGRPMFTGAGTIRPPSATR
jgi:hypothetical protein